MFEIDVGGYVNVVVGSYETGGGYVVGYCFGDYGGVGGVGELAWVGVGGGGWCDGQSSNIGNEIDVCGCVGKPIGNDESGGGFVQG